MVAIDENVRLAMLSTAAFAEEVAYTPYSGVAASVRGIFDLEPVDAAGGAVQDHAATFLTTEDQMNDLDGITVPTEPQSMNEIGPFANGKTYYIRRWERESDGFLRLHLIRKDS